jgi:hypothetical protein
MHAAHSESAKTLKLAPGLVGAQPSDARPPRDAAADPDLRRPRGPDAGPRLLDASLQAIANLGLQKTPPSKRGWLANQAALRPAEDAHKAEALSRFNENKLLVREILSTLQGLYSDLRGNLQSKEDLLDQLETLEDKQRLLAGKIDCKLENSISEIEQLE